MKTILIFIIAISSTMAFSQVDYEQEEKKCIKTEKTLRLTKLYLETKSFQCFTSGTDANSPMSLKMPIDTVINSILVHTGCNYTGNSRNLHSSHIPGHAYEIVINDLNVKDEEFKYKLIIEKNKTDLRKLVITHSYLRDGYIVQDGDFLNPEITNGIVKDFNYKIICDRVIDK